MQLDEAFGEGKAKTGSFLVVYSRCLRTRELFEDPRLILDRDTRSGIPDGR